MVMKAEQLCLASKLVFVGAPTDRNVFMRLVLPAWGDPMLVCLVTHGMAVIPNGLIWFQLSLLWCMHTFVHPLAPL